MLRARSGLTTVITARGINLLLFKSSGRALLFRGGNITVILFIRLLFLIRTSRGYITRPLVVRTLDI